MTKVYGKGVLRSALAGIVFVLFIVGTASPAHAQLSVYCVNCSDVIDQLTQEAYADSTLIQAAQQTTTQLSQLQNQIQMMQVTPSQAFSQVGSILNRLNEVSQGGNALSYAMANLDAQFTANYAKVGYAPTTSYASRYQQWSRTSLDTTQKALDVASQENANQQAEASLIANLQNQAQSADAAISTVQVGNQIAAEILNQLMALRQLMMADMSSKAAFQAQQVQEHDEATRSMGFYQPATPYPTGYPIR